MEAAEKNTAEQEELGVDFFEDVNLKVTIPRRPRMRDQVRRNKLFSIQRTVIDPQCCSIIPSLGTSQPSHVPPGQRRLGSSPPAVPASSWNVAVSGWERCAGWSGSPSL